MACSYAALRVNCCAQRTPVDRFKITPSSTFRPILRELQQIPICVNMTKSIKNTYARLLDAFVDSVFKFETEPLLPSQSNFAPINELGGAVLLSNIEGEIPDDFPEGLYIRNGNTGRAIASAKKAQNPQCFEGYFYRKHHLLFQHGKPRHTHGPNPLFDGLKSTTSIFGRSSHIWVEGEGMLHALYFSKDSDGKWSVVYKNRQVETKTLKLEKQRNKPSFLPATEGDSPAILVAFLLNVLRFGKVNKDLSNTNVFWHSGKLYSISENHLPQEIDIFTLQTLGDWDVNGAWNRPFTSHPKRAPGTGELVIMGVNATKPFVEVGVISADGKKLLHKVDLKLKRGTLSHEMAVTQRYNVFIDHPLSIDVSRLVRGGTLIKYNKEGYARIGVIPRFGDSNSIHWFEVKPNCTLHILNCFEDGDEVVVLGCRALESIIPGPDRGLNKFDWFSRKFKYTESFEVKKNGDATEDDSFFSCVYEWRLNMRTGEVKERNLTGTKFSMDFPMINTDFIGVKNKYGYTQVVDSLASSTSGMAKFGALAKLYLEEPETGFSAKKRQVDDLIKVELHKLEENTFCSGAAFVAKDGGIKEDDSWIITFVHNEDTNISQVYIIDGKKFCSEPVAKITLPCRVPYGFHGIFMPTQLLDFVCFDKPSQS